MDKDDNLELSKELEAINEYLINEKHKKPEEINNYEFNEEQDEINNDALDEEQEEEYTICSECETIIDDNDKFCPNCGCLFLDSSNLKYNKLEQTIKTILNYSTVVRCIITILAILIFIGGIVAATEVESALIFFTFLIAAIITFVSSLIFEAFANWFAYSLKSLYEIRRILFKQNK